MDCVEIADALIYQEIENKSVFDCPESYHFQGVSGKPEGYFFMASPSGEERPWKKYDLMKALYYRPD
jgi:hypothetical protein